MSVAELKAQGNAFFNWCASGRRTGGGTQWSLRSESYGAVKETRSTTRHKLFVERLMLANTGSEQLEDHDLRRPCSTGYKYEPVEHVVVMTHQVRRRTGITSSADTRIRSSKICRVPAGPYPRQHRYGEYRRYIDVAFDHVGKVDRWTGGPIHLTNQTAQDTALQSQIKTWRVPFDAFGNDLVGNRQQSVQDE
ncbi:hypothetical protein GGX14DRAFT_630116 [Mycena pura]|uniref:Uncharacterized protein n=1 Tax=Mycena pura TaxID=153505 RepID=A0AAD7E487_9AGAR|nr:hypothetical protein GGX14DRAFT_630116 [Mycena pura]